MSSAAVRPFVAALSLANLLLVRLWVELLGDFSGTIPRVRYGAALLDLAFLTAALWAVARWGGLRARLLLAVGSVALLAKEVTISVGQDVAAWKVGAAGVVDTALRQGWFWPVALAAIGGLSWVAWRTELRWASGVLVTFSPIVLVTAGQVAWRLLVPTPHAILADSSPSRRPVTQSGGLLTQPGVSAVTQPGARVVWLLFDELDERVAFSQRREGFRLPALDAFRAEAIVYRQATSPSNATADSVPQILGQVFERPGLRAGVVGWYIPYCDLYATHLAACQDWPMDRQINSYGDTLPQVTVNHFRSLFESSLYSLFGQSLAVGAHVRTVQAIEREAGQAAVRPDLQLVFLHLPAPHTPFVYRPAQHDLGAANQNSTGYLHNLALADRLFAGVRHRLEAAGLWTNSHVIVTGDHGFRQAHRLGYPPFDRHVPWMWKPAGPFRPQPIDRPFETRRAAAFVNRLLAGDSTEAVLAGYP